MKKVQESYDDYDSDSLIYISDDEFHYQEDVDKDLIKDIRNHSIQIFSGYYDYKKGWESPKIYLIVRGKHSGKTKIKIEGYYPYCLLPSDDGEYESYDGRPLEKILFKGQHPREVGKFRKKIEFKNLEMQPLEADVPMVRKILVDCSDFFKPDKEIEPKIAVIDIETNYPINDDLISFAVNDLNTGKLYFNSEQLSGSNKDLVLDLVEQLKQYDIVVGWNHREFDMQKISKNLRHIRKDYNIDIDTMATHYCATLDLMETSKKMYAKQMKGGWSLDNVGIQVCGIGKVEKDYKHPRELDHDTLIFYNIMDVVLPEEIDDVLGGIPCHLQLMKMLGCKLHNTEITALINDISTLKAYHREGKALSSKLPHWKVAKIRKWMDKNGIDYRYKAAEPDAIPGVYDNVVGLDLSAAYPSAVLAINASVETLSIDGKYRSPYAEVNGEPMTIRFKDGQSVFIKELQRLMNERYKVKDKLNKLDKDDSEYKRLKYIDFALKTQVAAYSHGIFGYLRSRMNVPEVAAAICATARTILDLIKYEVKQLGYIPCYRHTDSVFIAGIDNKKDAKEVLEYLNNKIEEFVETQGWNFAPYLDYEGFFPKAYIHSPARKVLIDEDGDWDTTGCNFIRAEVAKPLADIEKECIKMKLNKKDNIRIIKQIREMVKDLKDYKSSELGIEKPLNKPIEKYGRKLQDGTYGGYPYHIKAVQKAQEEYGFEIEVGDRYKIIPIFTGEIEGVRVLKWKREHIAFPVTGELPDMYEIDYEEYLSSNLWGKISDLVDLQPSELEQLVLTDEVRESLGIRPKPKKKDNEDDDK